MNGMIYTELSFHPLPYNKCVFRIKQTFGC